MRFNEFDLSTLFRLLRDKCKSMARNCIIAAVVGFLIAWCIPKEYESSASIIPETSANAMEASGLSALTSMAGINLNEGEDAIGPDLYPTVVESNRFVVELLYTPVETIDGEQVPDLLTYMKEYTRRPWWGYTRIWMGRLMKKINPPEDHNARGEGARINAERLSRDDEMLIEGLKNCIDCQMDEKTGMINISFRAQDPLVAKTIVDTLMLNLQEFITAYRTSKARIDLLHYQQIEEETRQKYEQAQKAYAAYCDTHMGTTLLQAYQTEMEALEAELSVALTAYTQVKQQVQLAEAKVQEKTPAFTVVEVASVPPRHASPHKLLMAIAFAFLALVCTVGWYYVRLLFGKDEPLSA